MEFNKELLKNLSMNSCLPEITRAAIKDKFAIIFKKQIFSIDIRITYENDTELSIEGIENTISLNTNVTNLSVKRLNELQPINILKNKK